MQNDPVITNVNHGTCQSRLYARAPKPYFVNWQQDGENQYEFFALISSMWIKYNRLKKTETIKKQTYE